MYYSLDLRRVSVRNIIKLFILSIMGLCCSFTALADATTNDPTKYVVTIVSPEDGATFQNDTQQVPVTFTIQPELNQSDQVALLVDGKADAGSTPGLSNPSRMNINISPLARGPHTLQVQIKNEDGKTILSESATITIYQQRPSKLLKPK